MIQHRKIVKTHQWKEEEEEHKLQEIIKKFNNTDNILRYVMEIYLRILDALTKKDTSLKIGKKKIHQQKLILLFNYYNYGKCRGITHT